MTGTAFEAKKENLESILDYMEEKLGDYSIEKSLILEARLKAEDLLSMMIENAGADCTVKLRVRKTLDRIAVRFSCKGSELDFESYPKEIFTEEFDEYERNLISSKLLAGYERDVHFSRRTGINVIDLTVVHKKKKPLLVSAGSMLAGIITGLLIKLLFSAPVSAFMADSVFGTGTALFIRAIKMIIPLMVFFSISSGLSSISDLKELGKTFSRVVITFFITSAVTIMVAYGMYLLFPIGNEALRSAVDPALKFDTMSNASSAREILINIIPDNFIRAFTDMDMLQLLFIAILTGITVAGMGKHSAGVNELLSVADELFEKMALVIVRFMPLCIFCATSSMMIKLNIEDVRNIATWMGLIYLIDIVILLLQVLMVPVFARTSPLWFVKNFAPVMMSAFAMASSNAVMPVTMQTCKDKLKISHDIYPFSIPLGAVINMNGGCVTLLISTLFLAKVYGITISGVLLARLFVMVFLLAVAAPAVPGGILLCLTVLLPQMGIPVEGLSIIIGLYFLVSMIQTMTNVTGTVTSSFVVDRRRKSFTKQENIL